MRPAAIAVRRATLFLQQDGRCFYCAEPMLLRTRPCARTTPPNLLTREHLIPRCEGGTNRPPNIVAACAACNNRRGTMSWLLFLCLTELERLPPGNFHAGSIESFAHANTALARWPTENDSIPTEKKPFGCAPESQVLSQISGL